MNASTATPVTFRASVSLMEDYRLGTEITAQTNMIQVTNAQGESELFYTGIDGKSSVIIYNVYPDPNSDTGWSIKTLIPNVLPGQLVGGIANGVFTLFCLGPDTSNPDLYYIQRDNNGNWGNWQHIDASSVFNNLTPPCYVRNFATGTVAGNLELAAIITDSSGQMTLWRVDWQGTLKGWQQLGNVDSTFLDFCATLTWGEGVVAAVTNDTAPNTLDITFFALTGGEQAVIVAQQYFRFGDIAFATPINSSNRYSGIFLYNDGLSGGSKSISYIDCGVNSPRAMVIDTSLTCEQMIAVDAGAEPICLMALDQHMRLNIVSQQANSTTFDPAIELGETITSMTAGLDADGSPVAFMINAQGNTIFSMQKQPDQASGEWLKHELDAQVQQIQKIAVYGTSFTLMDSAGNLLPNQTVLLSSPETTIISWQNQTLVVDENTSAKVITDSNGRIVLYSPTNTINANKLLFSLPDLLHDSAIAVDPDCKLQDKLKNLSVADTETLLPDQYKQDAISVQQAVTTAMSYTPAALSKNAARLVSAAEKLTGCQRLIDPESSKVRHWHFSVKNGRATFTELTQEEAQILKVKLLANAVNKPIPLDGFFDFLDDIADAVSNAVETAFEYVISTVSGVVTATISCIINGVKYLFDGDIQSLERAFQIAESIFNSVMVFFDQLYQFFAWLLSDGRQDIWNTKVAFEQLLSQAPPALTAIVQTGETKVGTFFADLKITVTNYFDQIIADYGNMNFSMPASLEFAQNKKRLNDTASILAIVQEVEVQAMWFYDKMTSPFGSSSSFTIPPQPQVQQVFQTFFTAFENSLSTEIQQQITDTCNYLSSVATNPENFAASTVKVLLQTAKNLVLLVLDILDGLAKLFLDAMLALLNVVSQWVFEQPITGFFLETIYNNVINPGASEQLTIARLVALVAAFPATIIYRAVVGVSPYSVSGPILLPETKAVTSTQEILGGALLCVYGIVDIALDSGLVNDSALLAASSIFLPILINGLICPGPGYYALKQGNTSDVIYENGIWWSEFVTAGFVFVITSLAINTNPRQDSKNLAAMCAGGIAQLVFVILKKTAVSESSLQTFIDIVSPLSDLAKPLNALQHPLARIGLGVIDGVSDLGPGISYIYLGSQSPNQNKQDIESEQPDILHHH